MTSNAASRVGASENSLNCGARELGVSVVARETIRMKLEGAALERGLMGREVFKDGSERSG